MLTSSSVKIWSCHKSHQNILFCVVPQTRTESHFGFYLSHEQFLSVTRQGKICCMKIFIVIKPQRRKCFKWHIWHLRPETKFEKDISWWTSTEWQHHDLLWKVVVSYIVSKNIYLFFSNSKKLQNICYAIFFIFF